MAFKLIVFIAILVAVAVLGMRGYRASVQGFEREHAALSGGGSSREGTDAAIRNAIETASKSIRHIDWFEVVETRGHIVDGKVGHFQVTLKIGFRLESE